MNHWVEGIRDEHAMSVEDEKQLDLLIRTYIKAGRKHGFAFAHFTLAAFMPDNLQHPLEGYCADILPERRAEAMAKLDAGPRREGAA